VEAERAENLMNGVERRAGVKKVKKNGGAGAGVHNRGDVMGDWTKSSSAHFRSSL